MHESTRQRRPITIDQRAVLMPEVALPAHLPDDACDPCRGKKPVALLCHNTETETPPFPMRLGRRTEHNAQPLASQSARV